MCMHLIHLFDISLFVDGDQYRVFPSIVFMYVVPASAAALRWLWVDS